VRSSRRFATRASPLCRFPFRLHRLRTCKTQPKRLAGAVPTPDSTCYYSLSRLGLPHFREYTPAADFCRTVRVNLFHPQGRKSLRLVVDWGVEDSVIRSGSQGGRSCRIILAVRAALMFADRWSPFFRSGLLGGRINQMSRHCRWAIAPPGRSGERAAVTLTRVAGYRRSPRGRQRRPIIRSNTHAPDQTVTQPQLLQ